MSNKALEVLISIEGIKSILKVVFGQLFSSHIVVLQSDFIVSIPTSFEITK